MRVEISDFFDLWYTRLFSFWRALFAAWSGFLVGAAAARTSTGLLVTVPITAPLHATPARENRSIDHCEDYTIDMFPNFEQEVTN